MTQTMMEPSAPQRSSLRDRLLLLRSQAMFEWLDDDGLMLLAENGSSASYRDGEVITAEGEPAHTVYVVIDGEISVTSNGKEVSVRKVGDAYGALPLLARVPSMQAVARGFTRTLQIPALAFESALLENHSLLRNTLKVIGAGVLATRDNLPADPDVSRTIDEGTWYEKKRSVVDLMNQLRQSPFGHMNLDALVDMARGMVDVRFKAGTVLWTAGESSDFSLHIDAGRVRCSTPDGRSVKIGRGYTIGVLDVWGKHERVYEAVAETDIIAFRIEFESFLSLLEMHPEVGLDLLRGFAADLLNERELKK